MLGGSHVYGSRVERSIVHLHYSVPSLPNLLCGGLGARGAGRCPGAGPLSGVLEAAADGRREGRPLI